MTEAPVSIPQTAKDLAKDRGGDYLRILETASVGILSIDGKGVIHYVNARGAAILGIAPEDLLDRSLLTLVVDENIAQAARILDLSRQGVEQIGEFRVRRADGAECWIRFTFTLVVGGQRADAEAVAIFEDVTDRRNLAIAEQQANRELQELYHNAPCGYHSLDAAGMLVQINDTELTWLGYQREEVIGRLKFTDLLVPSHRDAFRHNFALLNRHGRLRDNEYEMLRKDGTAFPVLLSATAVRDASGQFIRSLGSVFDISKRKWAENELGESEVRNAAILRAALDCIVSIDSDGKIIEFNPAAERAFGYVREQALGRDVADLIVSQTLRDVRRQGWEHNESNGESPMLGKRLHLTAMRSDGSQFPVEFAMTSVQLRSQKIYTAYLRDITKERWAEQELRRYADGLRSISRRLVQVQESERRAIANHLHDMVGQKLTALSINLNIVKSQLATALANAIGPRLDDSLALVEETVENIRDVMADLRPALLDDYGLTPVLRWYAERFAKRTGIATEVLEQGTHRRLPPAVEEALFRIVQEALANVAKYARANKATVTIDATPQLACLCITDDGCGFDSASSQQPSKSHGWGLMIMRERAAAVGAQVNVESAPGSGTKVTVTFRGELS